MKLKAHNCGDHTLKIRFNPQFKYVTSCTYIIHIVGRISTTAVASLNIPESGLFADFVKRFKYFTCFHG